MNTKNNAVISDYLSYPKRFLPYRWHKPLLAVMLAAGFWGVFATGISFLNPQTLEAIKTGVVNMSYDNLDGYSPFGALITFGSVALLLLAVFLGNRIVNARPFSSISSSRGGFFRPAFFKSLGAAVVLYVLPVGLYTVFTEAHTGEIKFTVLGFIVCTALLPLQCAAEEYAFRGLVMQMFGSWIRIPVIPIILQTVLFAVTHSYNIIGVISVALMGIVLGIIAYVTKGLEASCALHIVNNMTVFYLTGFGIGAVKKDIGIMETVIPLCFALLFLGFTVFATKKLGWYSKIKKDDAALFNAKIGEKKTSFQT